MKYVYLKVMIISLLYSGLSLADGGGTNQCDQAMQDGFNSAPTAAQAYSNRGLGMVHMLVQFLNQGFGNLPAGVLCHMVNDMGLPTKDIQLPYSVTKSFTDQDGSSKKVGMIVSAPTEAFAAVYGYNVKASVQYNGSEFLDMWFLAASDPSKSKGFLAMHSGLMNPNSAIYLLFDLSDPTAQIIKVIATNNATPAYPLGAANDMALVGTLSLNSVTQAISGFVTFLNNDGTVACNRIVVSSGSFLGSNLTLSFNVNGSPLHVGDSAWSTTDSTGLTSFSIADSTTANTSVAASPVIALGTSCAALKGYFSQGGILANGDTVALPDPTVVFGF